MDRSWNLAGFRLTANECSAAHMAADQAFGFEFRVCIGDRSTVDAELQGKFTARRNAVSRTQIACVYQGAKLVAQLDVERNVTFRLQMHRDHWYSQPVQYRGILCRVKSQFVFSWNE